MKMITNECRVTSEFLEGPGAVYQKHTYCKRPSHHAHGQKLRVKTSFFFYLHICQKMGCTLKRVTYLSFLLPSYLSPTLCSSPCLDYLTNSFVSTKLQAFASLPSFFFPVCDVLNPYSGFSPGLKVRRISMVCSIWCKISSLRVETFLDQFYFIFMSL